MFCRLQYKSQVLYLNHSVLVSFLINWTTYTILLNENGGWINQNTGQAATKAEIISVLVSMEELLIRGEFRRGGADTGGLDNVLLIGNP